jgi:predicted HicB family RNase H-like nuclease
VLSYRGYDAEISYSEGDRAIHGAVVNIADEIHFQGATVAELSAAFRESVDEYLEWCEQRGRAPAKPYSGTFLVRMDPDLHRRAALKAGPRKLNSFVVAAVERAVSADGGRTPAARPAATKGAKRPVAKKPVAKKRAAVAKPAAKKKVKPKAAATKPAIKKKGAKAPAAIAASRGTGQSTRITGSDAS